MSSDGLQARLLIQAATVGKRNLCQRLLGLHKAVPGFIESADASGSTPLMLAARFGHRDVVLDLLLAGARPDARSHLGNTAVHWACMGGYVEILQDLIRGGDRHRQQLLTGRNTNGDSPLMWASMAGQEAVVALIVTLSPAEIHHRNRDGLNAIMCAARGGYDAVLGRLLTDAGDANVVNTQDGNGNTALHFALEGRRPGCVRILLQYGPDLHQANRRARTPLDLLQAPDACPECRDLVLNYVHELEQRALRIENELVADTDRPSGSGCTTIASQASASSSSVHTELSRYKSKSKEGNGCPGRTGHRDQDDEERLSVPTPGSHVVDHDVGALTSRSPSSSVHQDGSDYVIDIPGHVTHRQRSSPNSVVASFCSDDVTDEHTVPRHRLALLDEAVEALIGEATAELGLQPEHCLGLGLYDLSCSQLDAVESALERIQARVRAARRLRDQHAVLDLSAQIVELRAQLDQLMLTGGRLYTHRNSH